MKKEYKKPDYLFVDFEMDTNIASSCEIRIAGHGWETCPIELDDGRGITFTIFGSAYVNDCTFSYETAQGMFDICYMTALPNNNLFGS